MDAHCGRFGNLFLVGMGFHFYAKKNNLKMKYKDHERFKKLGIDFYEPSLGAVGDSEQPFQETIKFTDENFFDLITGPPIHKNLLLCNDMWCQTKEFVFYLRDYFNEPPQKDRILVSNPFAHRYNNNVDNNKNNDVFVHVRLGDVTDVHSLPFEYYDKALQNIKSFSKGYISSDSIGHPICEKLIEKYDLTPVQWDVVETIQFASTCRHLVLSLGTFSWLVGFLAYFSDDVQYPFDKKPWHGDIFVFQEWKCVDY
jgi:hypothetical protein